MLKFAPLLKRRKCNNPKKFEWFCNVEIVDFFGLFPRHYCQSVRVCGCAYHPGGTQEAVLMRGYSPRDKPGDDKMYQMPLLTLTTYLSFSHKVVFCKYIFYDNKQTIAFFFFFFLSRIELKVGKLTRI